MGLDIFVQRSMYYCKMLNYLKNVICKILDINRNNCDIDNNIKI